MGTTVADVFISYSRKDAEFVAGLERALRARGKELWVDTDDIGPATKWREEIRLGVQASDGVIFVLSPDSLRSPECAKELAQALELKKRIVPVLRREPEAAVPEGLADYNWVYLRADDDFETGVGKLIEALDTDIEWVREHTRLGVRAAEWVAHHRNGAYLLRGSDLSEAEAFLTGSAGKQPEPSALQLRYVAVSRAGARRRQRVMFSSVCVALVVAIGLSVIAFRERSAAIASQQRAYSRQLAADAETQLGIDPELSVLLASRAYDVNPTAESVNVLRQALATSEIRMTVRPADGVSQAALTPDGRTMVTVGRGGGAVRLWRYPGGASLGVLAGVVAVEGQMSVNPVDGRVLVVDRGAGGEARVFSGRTPELSLGSGITAASWGAAGRYVVTGGHDGTVTVFDGRSGKRLASSGGHGAPVVVTAMSEDAHYLAAMAASGSVTLWDLRTRTVHVLSSPCPGGQGRMLFSPDATRLLTYGVEGCGFQLWNAANGAQVRSFGAPTTLSDPRAAATEAAFSSEGGYLVLAGEVADVRDASTGGAPGGTADQYLGHGGPVDAVAFTSDGRYVASSGADGTIRVWDPVNPTETLATLRTNGGISGTLAFAGSGEIVSVDLDGTAARVWDSGLQQPLAQLGNAQSETALLSPDGRRAIAEDQAGGLAVFDPRTGRPHEELPGSRGVAPAGGGFAPIDAGLVDNGQLVYDRSPTSVELWRTGDGASLRPASRAGSTPTAVWPAAAAARVAVAWRGGVIEVLDPLTGVSSTFEIASSGAGALSPDGSMLAIAERGRVAIIDVTDGRTRQLVLPGAARMLGFSGDGGHLAVGGTHFLDVYSLPLGRLAPTLISLPQAALTSLRLSRDGTLVAAGFGDQRARVWRVDSGDLVTTVQEQKQQDTAFYVGSVQISPDDRFLLTSVPGLDTSVWQISTGVQLENFQDPFGGWSDDSQLVLTSEGGGDPARSWSCDLCIGPQALRQLARTRVTRGFTAGERAKYLTQ